MRRRGIFLGAFSGLLAPRARAAEASLDRQVEAMAAALAARDHVPAPRDLPVPLAALDYDAYRRIVFRARPRRVGGFGLVPFHRGYLFPERVDVAVAGADGTHRPWPYEAADFTYVPPGPADLGFAGFRLVGALNTPDGLDEIVSFVGASFFRALGRGHAYGISARAVSLGLGGAAAEEFPAFRRFWVAADATGATIHALLDGPSLAGAVRVRVEPGDETRTDVHAALFPRRVLSGLGLAPASSMFWFRHGAAASKGRPNVHDSDVLAWNTPEGGRMVRELVNPARPRSTDIPLGSPGGFGLLQRRRHFRDFRDAEALYHRRPSLWVEPLGDWGAGALRLLELPTRDEYHDNIALCWMPADAPRPGEAFRAAWRLRWRDDAPPRPGLARIETARREGEATVLRFAGTALDGVAPRIHNAALVHFEAGGAAATLTLRAGPGARARLVRAGRDASETWWGEPA